MEKSHGKIYLPEQVLLWEEGSGSGSVCPVTGANEENLVAGRISDNSVTKGMSPEEIKEQLEAIKTFEAQQAEKELSKKMRDNPPHKQQVERMKLSEQERESNERMGGNNHNSRLGGFEEHGQGLKQLEREKAEKEMRRREANSPNITSENYSSHQSASQFSDRAFVGSSTGRPNQAGAWEQDYSRPNADRYQSETYAQPAPARHVPHIAASAPEAFSKQSSRVESGGLGTNPMQVDNLTLHDLELSSSTAEAFLGTIVCLKNNPNTQGVIRWVGSLPDYPVGVIAGIELVSAFVTL